MIKYQQAFTLVEAVVAAVIMAILAAVAVPIYTGYVRDQQQTTVDNLAETAAAAANAYFRRTGVDPPEGDVTPNTQPLNLYFNAANYRISVAGAANSVTVTDLKHAGISANRTY
jgi:prepilin-type N-terminal cleavage/methylation domain-containing protein